MTELGSKPVIIDPANPAGDILSKVTFPQWKDFLEKVRVYTDVARRAQNANDDEEAIRLLASKGARNSALTARRRSLHGLLRCWFEGVTQARGEFRAPLNAQSAFRVGEP